MSCALVGIMHQVSVPLQQCAHAGHIGSGLRDDSEGDGVEPSGNTVNGLQTKAEAKVLTLLGRLSLPCPAHSLSIVNMQGQSLNSDESIGVAFSIAKSSCQTRANILLPPPSPPHLAPTV
jgi:hypothetical protein